MKPQKLLVVINPVSGGTEKDNLRQQIKEFLFENAITAEIYETTGDSDEEHIKRLIKTFQPEAVAAAGGDGTVHLVARAMGKNKLPVAILPLGSGNGLSKDLGISQKLTEALQLLVHNSPRRIDTLCVNNRLCIHLADLGFNALVVKRFDEAQTRGSATYAKVAMQEYLSFEPSSYEIETDTENFSGKAFMVTITNARIFGSNATINPNAVMNDGLFEISILEPFPKPAALGILMRMYNDTIDRSVYSRIIRCRKAIIRNEKEELLQIDGEILPPVQEVRVEVMERNLEVLLPQDADQKL